MIEYRIENDLSPEEFKDILIKSTLGKRRPIDDHYRISKMIKNADLIITARDKGKLVGIARSLTDFAYCTYLSDLAVDLEYQNKGIGRELVRLTKKETPDASLILLSAPGAIDYYPNIGLTRHDACFVLNDIKDLKLKA